MNLIEVIIHVPHASKVIPTEYLRDYFDDSELNDSLLKLTDTFVDELVLVDDVNRIVFPYSRVFCDVERFLTNETMEKYGQGFYYTKGVNLKSFRFDLNKDMVKERYYNPHHLLLKDTVQKMNNPLIIDCHSFSNEIYPCTPFNDVSLPDFILGHNDKENEIKICEGIYNYLISLGYKVKINELYKGSLTIDDCPSIMIEINKRLYLSENLLDKRGDFYKIRFLLKTIIKKLQNVDIK